MKPRSRLVLVGAAFSACLVAAHTLAADVAQVTTDQFSKNITILGPSEFKNPFGGTYRQWRLRSWVDKQTKVATSQLYIELHYFWAWRFYDSAATDHAEQLTVTPIDRQVEDCSGMCSYQEVIGIAIDEAILRARAATGMQIKISAHSGDSQIIDLSAAQISAQLAALDQYTSGTSVTAGAATTVPPTQMMPKGRFGIHGVALNAQAISAIHLTSDHGFMVVLVDDGSPAAKAGLTKADVILSFNGTDVRSVDGLQSAIAGVASGTSVPIHIWRGGREMDVTAQF